MNILILDAYPKKNYRISKDLNGAYGTANNYGTSLFSRLLSSYVKYSVDFPPLYATQVCGELLNCGHNVTYCDTGKSIKELKSEKKYDLYIIASSIVCHETEIEYLKELKKVNFDFALVIGIGRFSPSKGPIIEKGEYESVDIMVTKLDDLFKTVQVKQQLLEEKSKTERYNYYGDDRDYAQCLKCPVVSKYSHVIRKRMWEYAKSLNNDEDLFKVFMANQPY